MPFLSKYRLKVPQSAFIVQYERHHMAERPDTGILNHGLGHGPECYSVSILRIQNRVKVLNIVSSGVIDSTTSLLVILQFGETCFLLCPATHEDFQ